MKRVGPAEGSRKEVARGKRERWRIRGTCPLRETRAGDERDVGEPEWTMDEAVIYQKRTHGKCCGSELDKRRCRNVTEKQGTQKLRDRACPLLVMNNAAKPPLP